MFLIFSLFLFARIFAGSVPVPVSCETNLDPTACANAGCNWNVEDAECEYELPEVEASDPGEVAEDTAEANEEAAEANEPGEADTGIECDLYVGDQATCESNGCVYSVDLEGEPECQEPEAEAGEPTEAGDTGIECDLYVGDQATCESNGCVYFVDLEGEPECQEAEVEAGETVEETAEQQEDQAEANAEAAEEGGVAVEGATITGEAEDVDPLEPGEVAEPLEPEDQAAGTYIESEEPETEPFLRKPLQPKEAGTETDVGSWFLLGCTFLISVIFSVWCVTKTVEYFDRREYGIDLDNLTEEYNYESLA